MSNTEKKDIWRSITNTTSNRVKLVEPVKESPTVEVSPIADVPKGNRTGVVWEFLDKLHNGNISQAKQLITSKSPYKPLLKGILAVWEGNVERAESLLGPLIETSLDTIATIDTISCWAHIMLAIMYLDNNNDSLANYHILRARVYTHSDRQDTQFLLPMVELIEAESEFNIGSNKRAYNNLTFLETQYTDNYLRGVIFYLMGCLGRFEPESDNEKRIEALKYSLNVFTTEHPNRYRAALAKLELSHCSIDIKLAINYVIEAKSEFKDLGRKKELLLANARHDELIQEAEIFDVKYVSQEKKWRVGNTLFISPSMKAIRQKLTAIGPADLLPVLILGSSGCGKEMIAEAIHQLSPRANHKMEIINCSTLPHNLIDTTLFGYEPGAFTDAKKLTKGIFETASNTTLFLDEFGDLPLEAQAKVLRVLDNRTFRRVGGSTEIVTNVRVIAATNKNVYKMVENNLFREDLLYRFGAWVIKLPPLNERREEIMPMVDEFLKVNAKPGEVFELDFNAKRYLLNKDYPGNIRMLKNDILRGISVARSQNIQIITAKMLFDAADLVDKTPQAENGTVVTEPHEIEPFEKAVAKAEKK